MTQSILVVADDNDDLSIEKAHSIASSLDVKLEVVRFLPVLDNQDELQCKQAVETAKNTLDHAISNIFGEDAQVTCNVIATNEVVDWIMSACKEKKFDFVVKTGQRTESFLHTPMDWKLMRKLPCPILLASNRKWKSKQVIVAAVDLSTKEKLRKDYNNIVLKWTALLSDVFNCQAHIVYSIPIAKPLLEFDVVDKHEVQKRKQPEAEKRLSSLITKFNLDHAHTHITAGPPEKNIPSLANELKADLVIMGCVGQKGLKGFLFSNATENTLHHLRTDILICRSRREKMRK